MLVICELLQDGICVELQVGLIHLDVAIVLRGIVLSGGADGIRGRIFLFLFFLLKARFGTRGGRERFHRLNRFGFCVLKRSFQEDLLDIYLLVDDQCFQNFTAQKHQMVRCEMVIFELTHVSS
jgi:hypothetical protein